MPEPLPWIVLRKRTMTTAQEVLGILPRWRDLARDGMTALTSLVNAGLEARYADRTEMWHPVLQEFPGLVSWYGKATRERVEERKALLERLLGSMDKQIGKLRDYLEGLKGMYEGGREQHGEDEMRKQAVLLTWTLDQTIRDLTRVYEQYERETALKRRIAQEILKERDREQATAWLSAWLNEPELDDEMIKEVEEGLRLEVTSGPR